MTILSALEDKMTTRLAPLVTANTLKAIDVEVFSAAGDAEELLERFKSRAPAGFLSVPTLVYTNPKASNRSKVDFNADYNFLAVSDNRRNTAERVAMYYAVQQHMLLNVGSREFADSTLDEGWEVDLTTLVSSTQIDFEKVGAMLVVIRATVRGPARDY